MNPFGLGEGVPQPDPEAAEGPLCILGVEIPSPGADVLRPCASFLQFGTCDVARETADR